MCSKGGYVVTCVLQMLRFPLQTPNVKTSEVSELYQGAMNETLFSPLWHFMITTLTSIEYVRLWTRHRIASVQLEKIADQVHLLPSNRDYIALMLIWSLCTFSS